MKEFLDPTVLAGVQRRLSGNSRLLLFFNFDETLGSRTGHGKAVPLGADVREKLRELSELTAHTLVFVSSHSLGTLKKLVGFTGVYLIANEGLEIFGPDLNLVHADAKKAHKTMVEILHLLKPASEQAGVRVEDRKFAVIVNLSQASPKTQQAVRELVEGVWLPRMDSLTLQERNLELSLRPRLGWNRGRAVLFLWNKFATPRKRPQVVYVGAEENDEEIFSLLGREGVGVKVGGGRDSDSRAAYHLKNVAEVNKLIDWVLHRHSHPLSRTPGLE